ncbi:MAG TPA: PQQ-binding-like beta-propeller repeat protein [Jatrophihabitans sp.]|nr:PQQ-binding-like beta-propeller repeat protein [Jatrophihabitans sp.]
MRLLVAAALAALLAGCSGSAGHRASSPASSPSTSPATSAASSRSVTGSEPPQPQRQPDWSTYHGTPDRAGNATQLPTVRAARVATTIKLDGAVYASPIVADGMTIVATENDTVYAFDAAYHQVWKRHLGSPAPRSQLPCGNIDPLGITGTPVYDRATGLVYVAAEYGGPPRHELVALRLTNGAVAWQHTLDLPGVETAAMQQRGALALTSGRVYVPFGGLAGDCGGYKGRVVGYATDGSGAPIAYTVPTAREAGIWAPPGVVVGGTGRLYVAVGNGASVQGDPYDHSDSILALSPDLKLLDSFSPATWPTDNANDLDLGSQGPAVVGQWIFTAGKSGTAYVLRRDHLGGIGGQVSHAALCRSFGGTAVAGDVVYVPCTDGLRAVRIDSAGRLHVLWHADPAITGSPVVGGGRVWSLDPNAGALRALDPATGNAEIGVHVGATSRFATPAVHARDLLIPMLAGLTVVRTS